MTTPGPDARFAIVPVVPYGAPPENAIASGSLATVTEYLPDTVARADAIARLDNAQSELEAQEAEQQLLRTASVAVFADCVKAISRRLDAYIARRDSRARDEAEREAAEEQARIQQTLDALPNPDDRGAYPFNPQGDLHSISASHPEDKTQLAATERPLADDQGQDTGEFEVPEPAERPAFRPSRKELASMGRPEPPPQQPISVSLNAED